MKIFFIVTSILVALKLTQAKAQNIIFLRASGNTEHFWCGGKLLNRLSAVAAHAITAQAICYCSYPPRALRALIFVALIIQIVSCNNKKKFMVYLQNYFNCSSLTGLAFRWSETVTMLAFYKYIWWLLEQKDIGYIYTYPFFAVIVIGYNILLWGLDMDSI
jgi:hypothetical protein